MLKKLEQIDLKKVTTIGGGSGQYILLSALCDINNLEISAIVSMADNGGSTGRLRDELGVLPPGDILKCLVALSKKRNRYRELLMKRFSRTNNRKLIGHTVGNMLLTFLSEYIGDFPAATTAFGKLLETRGKVLPVTINKINLVASLENGQKIFGETNIDVLKENKRSKITGLKLKSVDQKKIKAYPASLKAIEESSYLIIGPGDIYTSILPNLIVPGVRKAVQQTKAKLVYVVNIMTKNGETNDFNGDDFVSLMQKYLRRPIDIILANSAQLSQKVLQPYKQEKANLVRLPTPSRWPQSQIIATDLLSTKGDLARHDVNKLKEVLRSIL